MKIIPRKYFYEESAFPHDWSARTVGGPGTMDTIWWSRETYGIDWSRWSIFLSFKPSIPISRVSVWFWQGIPEVEVSES